MGLPPAKIPVSGWTVLTMSGEAATQYARPVVEKSCPLVVTSTGTLRPPRNRGVMHSRRAISWLYVAGTTDELVLKRQKYPVLLCKCLCEWRSRWSAYTEMRV